MEVSRLTGTGDAPSDTSGMPGSDTSDFSVTSVRFLLKMANTPSVHDTLESVSLGNSENVNDFVLSEDVVDADLLLEEILGEADLITGGFTTVDLHLEDVVLLLSQVAHKVVLSVHDSSHHSGVFADAVQLDVNFGLVLGLSLVLGEGFLLGLNPVLVEAAESSLVEMAGPNGSQGSQASGSLDVANKTDNLQGRGLDDGNGFNFLLLVEFGLSTVDISEDVGHASFEASEGCEVGGLGAVISGEGSDVSSVVFRAFAGEESQVALSGTTVFTVGHVIKIIWIKIIKKD